MIELKRISKAPAWLIGCVLGWAVLAAEGNGQPQALRKPEKTGETKTVCLVGGLPAVFPNGNRWVPPLLPGIRLPPTGAAPQANRMPCTSSLMASS